MKAMMNLIVTIFLLAIPIASESRTIAFSPSSPGQPLIFHFSTALNPIQPSQYSAVTWTQLENALLIRSSYKQHLDHPCNRNCCAKGDLWADAIGQGFQQNQGNKHQFGYNVATGGITVGADTCCNNLLVGAAGSYTFSDLGWKRGAGNARINSYYGGLYASWKNGCFYINASAIGAFSNYHTSRHYRFSAVDNHAHARHKSWEALGGIDAGFRIKRLICFTDVIPFVCVDYVYLAQQKFTESGADRFNLHLRRRSDQYIQSEAGIRFTQRFTSRCSSWTMVPDLSFSYINQSPLTERNIRTSFVDMGREFVVNGWDFERNLGAVALNLNFLNQTETRNITIHYEGQFGKYYWNQTGGVMCNYCF